MKMPVISTRAENHQDRFSQWPWQLIDISQRFLGFRRVIVATLVGIGVGFGPGLAAAKGIQGEISRVGDTSHLEFKGLVQWPYELKRLSPTKFSLQIPSFDESTLAQLSSWSDPLVTEVKIRRDGPDGNYEVTFTVADESVESFDYLTDEPSRLIVDFYRQVKPTEGVAKVEASTPAANDSNHEGQPLPQKTNGAALPKKSAKSMRVAETSDGYKKAISRRPAGDERLQVPAPVGPLAAAPSEEVPRAGAFDAADPKFSRFLIRDYEINDESILASRKNFYVHFPMLKMPTSESSEMLANMPEFIINPKETQENKEARLLLSLYSIQTESKGDRHKDRIGAFLKVYDHFLKTFPESEYDETVRSLAAHMYYLRWKQSQNPTDYDASITLYKYLIAHYPESALAERNRLWIAYSEMDRGNGVGVIQEFQDYLNHYPKTDQIDKVKRAIADGFILLHKYEDAKKIYDELERSGAAAESRIEATFRLGDVSFSQRDYAAAEKFYKRALEKYPQLEKTYANVRYNMAEAQFWQGKFKDSLENHVKFLALFPEHDYAGYSMTRAGELLEALGADRSRVMGAFLESYYRYPKNPGSEVARIRLLSQQMKNMKSKELQKALAEMKDIGQKSPLSEMAEFVVLMGADGRQRRGDNYESLDQLISFYQGHPTSAHLHLFKTRILRNIAEILGGKSDRGEFMEALAFNNKYTSTWLNGSDRLDVPYFLARSYEQAGVFDEAKLIYEQDLAKRLALKGTPKERERRLNEILPTAERIRLRLAAVAYERRDYPEAYRQLQALKDSGQLNVEENLEHILLTAKVMRERGQLEQAKTFLSEFISTWKGEPEALIENMLELADLQLKTNRPIDGERLADQILAMKKQGTKLTDEIYAKTLEMKGDCLVKQTKDMAAVETFQKLLEEFESARPLANVRYKVGDLLFRHGDIKGAEDVWMNLDETKQSALRRLAQEKLDNSKWQSEHKKYINRIPAMSKFKEE